MNETSAFLWKEVSGKEFTIDDLVKLLVDNYQNEDESPLDPNAVRADVEALVQKWIEAEIVEP